MGESRVLSSILQALDHLPLRLKQKAYHGVNRRSSSWGQLPSESCPLRPAHQQVAQQPLPPLSPSWMHVPQTTGPLHRLSPYLNSLCLPLHPIKFLRLLLNNFFLRGALTGPLPGSDTPINAPIGPWNILSNHLCLFVSFPSVCNY